MNGCLRKAHAENNMNNIRKLKNFLSPFMRQDYLQEQLFGIRRIGRFSRMVCALHNY